MIQMISSRLLILFLILFVSSCARSPLKSADQALRFSENKVQIADDLGLENLKESLKIQVQALNRQGLKVLRFGPKKILSADYALSLNYLLSLVEKSPEVFFEVLQDEFDQYEVYGREDWGEVFMTSYFEPVVEARKKPEGRWTQALYSLPPDLVTVRLRSFKESFPHWSLWQSSGENPPRLPVLRGRLVSKKESGLNYLSLVPYLSREEIDEKLALKGKKLELYFVDPIDSFFMQIQGSSTLRLKNGKEVKVGYAGQNGHPYEAIGQFLFDVIPREEMSLQKIEAHLKSLPSKERQELLNKNSSYVFFKEKKENAVTSFGVPAVEGRSIATDQRYFPKGGLAILEFSKPLFETGASTEPYKETPVKRIVLDHDTGGAIKGPGRLDLFAGRGAKAKQFSGVIRSKGQLRYFVPSDGLMLKLKRGAGLP